MNADRRSSTGPRAIVTAPRTASYIYHAVTNDRLKGDAKLIWGVFLFMANILVMPVYWYLYIWREPDELPAAGNAAS